MVSRAPLVSIGSLTACTSSSWPRLEEVLDPLAVPALALELGHDDLVDVQEAVLLEADVDEGGLHARQDVVDGAEVDVAGDRAALRALEVDLGDLAVLEDGDPPLARCRPRRAARAWRPAAARACWRPAAAGAGAAGASGRALSRCRPVAASACRLRAACRLLRRPPFVLLRAPRRRAAAPVSPEAASGAGDCGLTARAAAALPRGSPPPSPARRSVGSTSVGGAGACGAGSPASRLAASCFLRRRNQSNGKRSLLVVCARTSSHSRGRLARDEWVSSSGIA